MKVFLKKLIDQGFMTDGQGQYIVAALNEKESFIISGHKGWGILPLMATISGAAKSKFKIKQVKSFEDLESETDFLLIADLKNIDYGKLVEKAILVADAAFISLKDPDHPYSIFKILKDIYKNHGPIQKAIHILECAKTDEGNKLIKMTKVTIGEKGRLEKSDFEE